MISQLYRWDSMGKYPTPPAFSTPPPFFAVIFKTSGCRKDIYIIDYSYMYLLESDSESHPVTIKKS